MIFHTMMLMGTILRAGDFTNESVGHLSSEWNKIRGWPDCQEPAAEWPNSTPKFSLKGKFFP
jgi:hypothetical protein